MDLKLFLDTDTTLSQKEKNISKGHDSFGKSKFVERNRKTHIEAEKRAKDREVTETNTHTEKRARDRKVR